MRPAPHTSPPTPPEDVFRYGWRYVQRTTPDGAVEVEQVPLTLEDVLHPQEDDHIVNSNVHAEQCRYLADVCHTLPIGPEIALVTEDQGVKWGVEGMRDHSPDVAVFVGLHTHPGRQFAMLDLAESGGRPVVVIEVVSPNSRANDMEKKVDHYHRARVPLYIAIDQKKDDGPRTLVGHRWASKKFEEFGPDKDGRMWVEPLGLYLTIRDNRVVCLDREGREIGDYARISQQLEEADQRLEEQEQAIEEAVEGRNTERAAKETAQRQAREADEGRDTERAAKETAQRQAREADEGRNTERVAKEAAQRQAREADEARALALAESRAAATARAEAERQARAAAEARDEAKRRAQAADEARAKVEAAALAETEAHLRDARAAVLELAEVVLGQPEEEDRLALDKVADPVALRDLRRRVRQVRTWKELLASASH